MGFQADETIILDFETIFIMTLIERPEICDESYKSFYYETKITLNSCSFTINSKFSLLPNYRRRFNVKCLWNNWKERKTNVLYLKIKSVIIIKLIFIFKYYYIMYNILQNITNFKYNNILNIC